MNNGKMKMDNSLPGKSGQARLTNFWVGAASVMLVCASAHVVAQVASPRGANPTPNQLIAYCEAEWNRATDNGYSGFTGSHFIFDALKASSEGLRSGAWLTEQRRATLKDAQALADCLSRGVLAGRNGTFRTPSMIVKGIYDEDTRGRQDPTSGGMTVGGAEGGNTPKAQRLNTQLSEAAALGTAPGASAGAVVAGSQNRSNIEVQSAPQCAKYYVVSETQETRTTPKMFSFGIQNICNFPVYISWNGYFNDVETQSIDYAIRLKRGTSSRPIFGPGEKIEAIPFRIATQRRFHARINSVCPTEDEATRLTGKRISYIAQGAPGICIAQISDPSGVRSAQ